MKHIAEHLTVEQCQQSFHKALCFADNQANYYTIEQTESSEAVGILGLSRAKKTATYDFGILLLQKYHRQGVPVEVLSKMFDYCFQENIAKSFSVKIHTRNSAANLVAKRLGMTMFLDESSYKHWKVTQQEWDLR